ncbi:ATP synthase F0 [Phlyctema vagabunda]|uniref:ATP synthase F0 n=1 Tax=Phlyctema vagabunda TaxID=108571 RepID=A0ABR4PWG5_9HELO
MSATVLIVLSLISFLPQIQRIVRKKSSVDISLTYILLNTISATEQFTLGFYLIAIHGHDADFFVGDPRNLGDWLNLTQLVVVWLASLVLFAVCLVYAPSSAPKARAVAIYVAFLLISVVPLFVSALKPGEGEDERWIDAIFYGVHSMLVNPLVTLGAAASLCFQWQEAAALSSTGLAAQAVVFAAVALSWISRVRFLEYVGDEGRFPFVAWYQLVSWAVVDNGIFALVQAVLFCLAKRHPSGLSVEDEPLLGH